MSEYTVTFPVHLGQKVWVSYAILPPISLENYNKVPDYLVGEIIGLRIQSYGKIASKTMKIRIKESWFDESSKEYIESAKHFKFSVGAIGKAIFDKEPEGGNE